MPSAVAGQPRFARFFFARRFFFELFTLRFFPVLARFFFFRRFFELPLLPAAFAPSRNAARSLSSYSERVTVTVE